MPPALHMARIHSSAIEMPRAIAARGVTCACSVLTQALKGGAGGYCRQISQPRALQPFAAMTLLLILLNSDPQST